LWKHNFSWNKEINVRSDHLIILPLMAGNMPPSIITTCHVCDKEYLHVLLLRFASIYSQGKKKACHPFHTELIMVFLFVRGDIEVVCDGIKTHRKINPCLRLLTTFHEPLYTTKTHIKRAFCTSKLCLLACLSVTIYKQFTSHLWQWVLPSTNGLKICET